MCRVWRVFQGGGMGLGAMPDPGGSLDQPAIMLDCFGLMSAAEAAIKGKN